jgi:hypothetical protein
MSPARLYGVSYSLPTVLHRPVQAPRTISSGVCGGEPCCEERESDARATIETVITSKQDAVERQRTQGIETPRDGMWNR